MIFKSQVMQTSSQEYNSYCTRWVEKVFAKYLLQRGVEPKILQEFSRQEGLTYEWIDAKFTWGSIVPETGQ